MVFFLNDALTFLGSLENVTFSSCESCVCFWGVFLCVGSVPVMPWSCLSSFWWGEGKAAYRKGWVSHEFCSLMDGERMEVGRGLKDLSQGIHGAAVWKSGNEKGA